jgi:uncharacterized SAM-binding protein YcdF (DUF218 family)
VTGRRLVGVLVGALALVVLYLGFTFVEVWLASRRDQARPVQAIVVLGAAQYNGRPSPVLRARLDHAYDLWREKLAPTVVVTGGREPGDRFTEATASANYLESRGVPDADVLRETGGRNSWESLAASAAFLKVRGVHTVLLVSDPFHNERITLMADEVGLRPYVSPTRTSPIRGVARVPYFAKETLEVAIGRIIGFRHLTEWAGGLDSRMQPAKVATTRSGVV